LLFIAAFQPVEYLTLVVVLRAVFLIIFLLAVHCMYQTAVQTIAATAILTAEQFGVQHLLHA